MGFTRVAVEWNSAGEMTFASADESCLHTQPLTRLFVSSSNAPVGVGTLYVTSHHVLWTADAPSSGRGSGYRVEYYDLLMHAVSRETDDFPHASIYCQVEQPADGEEEEEGDDDEGPEKEKEGEGEGDTDAASAAEGDPVVRATEVRFVPDDPAAGQPRIA